MKLEEEVRFLLAARGDWKPPRGGYGEPDLTGRIRGRQNVAWREPSEPPCWQVLFLLE